MSLRPGGYDGAGAVTGGDRRGIDVTVDALKSVISKATDLLGIETLQVQSDDLGFVRGMRAKIKDIGSFHLPTASIILATCLAALTYRSNRIFSFGAWVWAPG